MDELETSLPGRVRAACRLAPFIPSGLPVLGSKGRRNKRHHGEGSGFRASGIV